MAAPRGEGHAGKAIGLGLGITVLQGMKARKGMCAWGRSCLLRSLHAGTVLERTPSDPTCESIFGGRAAHESSCFVTRSAWPVAPIAV